MPTPASCRQAGQKGGSAALRPEHSGQRPKPQKYIPLKNKKRSPAIKRKVFLRALPYCRKRQAEPRGVGNCEAI